MFSVEDNILQMSNSASGGTWIGRGLLSNDSTATVQRGKDCCANLPWWKRPFDVGATVLLLPLLAAPLLLVALAIKLDSPGPVFFRQPRLGLNNQIIRVWKFRSMYCGQSDIDGASLTKKNDPRITRIGALIRRTSIDELPQLLNVLAGDMSLVGPRPHPLQAKVGTRLYAEVVPDYHQRHVVRPGITGWAQVNGCRGETVVNEQIEQRVAHDLYYIRRQSFWFDFRILFLTIRGLCTHDAF